ncbi:VWA domain-containing protein (plasmid) [Brevibacillus laterosporus]|uniref:VWA domain-containing protein n=1 Tax=Brevibacillus laterosporus TaxID=1465 RepID=A0A518V1U8_BRELA|nr:VWA domain-containing protein [Brevibacillus laterosporus]
MYKSVLNTDSYDKRRFKEIFQMSNKMKILETAGANYLPSFLSLMGDIWAGLFKLTPVLADKVDPSLLINQEIIQRVFQEESFESFRSYSRLDDLTSAIGTINFSEQSIRWFEEKVDIDTKQALEQASNNQKQIIDLENKIKKISEKGQEQLQPDDHETLKDLKAAMSEKDNQVKNLIEQALMGLQNTASMKSYVEMAINETHDLKNEVSSLFSGSQAGKQDSDLKTIPLKDQLLLAELLKKNKKLRDIALWAGRFKSIARKKQRSKHTDSFERSGITTGNSLELILPSELALYLNSASKVDFMKRFAEGEVLQYAVNGKESLGKGPIILCLDESGSMKTLDEQAKGFVLSLLMIAKKQRRDFALIKFSKKIQTNIYKKGKITAHELITLATSFLGGGTNFELPLEKSLQILDKDRFSKSDIIFVTDGEDNLSESFITSFNEKKKEKDFQVLSILLKNNNTQTIQSFSDEIILASDIYDEAVMKRAFSI